MAMMKRRSRYGMRRNRRTSGRRYRYAVVLGSNIVTPNNNAVIDLLSPVQPASTIADSIYQQMTMPTLIGIEGYMVIGSAGNYTKGADFLGGSAGGAWGIYVDKDIATSGTALPPYSLGFTTSWMVHRAFFVNTPAYFGSGAGSPATLFDSDLQYRRYEFNLRRYKRKLDSFNDTLTLCIENASTSSIPVSYTFYMRLLLLE